MIDFEKGSTNVYADLGWADAAEMLVKAQLMVKISEIIKQRGLTQAAAAEILGVPQPKLSKMLRGQFRGVSEDRLMRCLVALGHNVHIVVEPARKGRSGSLTVSGGKRVWKKLEALGIKESDLKYAVQRARRKR